jgi:serine/threonine protein kinase
VAPKRWAQPQTRVSKAEITAPRGRESGRTQVDMVDVGQVINGKYRVVRLIGDGGMGSVYEANHQVLGVNVALKFLHPELSEEFNLKERFLQEARVSATIHSPHIVRVLDVDVWGDRPYLVMDLLRGEPLQRRMTHHGRLSVAQTLEYANQILLGLQEAHDKNIVHRDLKPDNVFITKGQHGEELLKILDFGIAKLRQDAGKSNLTQPGAVMGTPEYMAPEQAYSADQVDARSDVYSVGVILFEMLSGKRPAEGETPQEIAHKILMGQVLRLDQIAPDVPAGLVRVIHTAMEARPEDRWADARALREALMPFAPVNPFASTGVARPLTGQGVPFVQVSKTPRLDGVRGASASDRPPTRVDAADKSSAAVPQPAGASGMNGRGVDSGTVSLNIPVVVASEQVPATIPPSAGPPRASALPPDPMDGSWATAGAADPATAATVRQTADMKAAPDMRGSSVGGTVNLPQGEATGQTSRTRTDPMRQDSAERGPTVQRGPTMMRRRTGPNWGLITAFAVVLIGAGGWVGYYFYEGQYDSLVPPPRPVRRTPVAVIGETIATPSASAADTGGPTQLQPLDPGALAEDPARDRWQNTPPAPPPSPRPGQGATPTGSAPGGGTAAPASTAPSTPVFSLPTAIPLPGGAVPISIPTALPTGLPPLQLPTGFTIPGLTPPAPAANPK